MTIIIYRAATQTLISDWAATEDLSTTKVGKIYASTTKAGAPMMYAIAGSGPTLGMTRASNEDEVVAEFEAAPAHFLNSEMIVVTEHYEYTVCFIKGVVENTYVSRKLAVEGDWAIGGWKGHWNRNQASVHRLSAERFCSLVTEMESLGGMGCDWLSLSTLQNACVSLTDASLKVETVSSALGC